MFRDTSESYMATVMRGIGVMMALVICMIYLSRYSQDTGVYLTPRTLRVYW